MFSRLSKDSEHLLGVHLEFFCADSDSDVNKEKRENRVTPSKILVVDIVKEIIEEDAMIRKLKSQREQEVAIQQIQTHQRNLKVKKDLNHRWIKLIKKI